MLTVYLVATLSLLSYLWLQANNARRYYTELLTEQQTLQHTLADQLAQQLPYQTMEQMQLRQLLTILSDNIPPSIWLTILHYEPQKLTLKGYSPIYPEITGFAKVLLQQAMIIKSQIQSVKMDHDGLQFEMFIEFDQQNQ